MLQKNNGQGTDHIMQNQFTAYINIAIRRKKNMYLAHKNRQLSFEFPAEDLEYLSELSFTRDFSDALPLFMQLENQALHMALKQIKDWERYIFLSRVLDDKSFEDLAVELGMGYKGVAAAYYRVIQKIKTKMKEVQDEF